MKECNYHLDRRQRKLIKRSVEEAFGQEALLAYKSHQRRAHNKPSHRTERISKASSPESHWYERARIVPEEKDLDRLTISGDISGLYDISLLGPGEPCPSPTSVAAPVRLHKGELILKRSSETRSGKESRRRQDSMPSRPVDSCPTLSSVRDVIISNSYNGANDSKIISLSPPLRANEIERAALLEAFAVRPSKAEIGDVKGKVFNTAKRDNMAEGSALVAAAGDWDYTSIAQGAADNASSCYSKTGGSRWSGPDLQSSVLSKISGDNSSEHNNFQHRTCKEVPIKARADQLQTLKHQVETKMTQSSTASSYSTALSPMSPERELVVDLEVSRSASQDPLVKHAAKPLELIDAGQSQEGTSREDASKVNRLITGERNYSFDRLGGRNDMQPVGRRRSLNPQHVHKIRHEEEMRDLRTFTIRRTNSSRDQAPDIRHSTDELVRDTEQSVLPNKRFRPNYYLPRPDIHSPAQVSNRSSNRLTGSLRHITSSQSKTGPASLADLKREAVSAKLPGLERVENVLIDPTQKSCRSISAIVQRRELGLTIGNELRSAISKRLHPWRTWRGASGDVVACAWGPDSMTYAAGAAAHVNVEDQQYNRSCNLLLGDLMTNRLQELPYHRVSRPHPITRSTDPEPTEGLSDVLDPMLYKTVSSIQFSPDGSKLYTGSHDSTVKVWNISRRACMATLRHGDEVTSVEVSKMHDGVFATASKIIDDPVRVYYPNLDNSYEGLENQGWVGFSSPRAQKTRTWEIYPECIRWGLTSSTSHLLLVGFQQWEGLDGPPPAREGELCLFDLNHAQRVKVSPSSQSVHSVAWHPLANLFATGGAAGKGVLTNRQTTKTVVRTWDLRNPKSYAMEYECPAIDMQDITFHPQNPHYVTASCTNGSIYVWDFRRPDRYLQRLRHGAPLMDWNRDFSREEMDPGVMLNTWGEYGTKLFTGSSDGMVKEWDVLRSPENALVRDVAQLGAGVQSGAFSPDFSNLLIGDASGAVHVLSSSPMGPQASDGDDDGDAFVKKTMPIQFVHAIDQVKDDGNPGIEGILAGNERLKSSELIVDREYGVCQGPDYRGPYARWARSTYGDVIGDSVIRPEVQATCLAAAPEKKTILQERTAMLEDDAMYRLLEEKRRVRERKKG